MLPQTSSPCVVTKLTFTEIGATFSATKGPSIIQEFWKLELAIEKDPARAINKFMHNLEQYSKVYPGLIDFISK